jgi:small-conductance mechanosensitive channel
MRMNVVVPKGNDAFANSPKTKRAKYNVRDVAVTQAVVGAILFLLCSLLVVLFPGATAKFTAYAFHTDLSRIMQPPSFSGFVTGLIVFSLGFGLISALAASVYNNLTKNAA